MPNRFLRKAISSMFVILVVAVFGFAPAAVDAAEPRAAFDTAMADIAKSTLGSAAEAAAMEKAIAAARALKPPPAVPDATIAFEGRAEAAAKTAKDKSGFKAAADEFGKAARVAPWVPAYHYNRGILLEKAEDYAAAKRSLELYLKAAPDAADTREVKKKIAGIDYLAGQPKESASPGMSAQKEDSARPQASKLAGRWYVYQYMGNMTQKPTRAGPWNDGTSVDGEMEANIKVIGNDVRITLFARHPQYLPLEYSGRLNGQEMTGTVTIAKDPHPRVQGLAPNYAMTPQLSRQLFPCGPASMTQREPFIAEIDPAGNNIVVYSRGFLDEATCARNNTWYSWVFLLSR
jgi:tetratricopeptide (TPR) repeat protein